MGSPKLIQPIEPIDAHARGNTLKHTLTRTSGFKIQLKTMFIDTALNSVATVFANLYQSFYESAVRCLEYARVLSQVRTTCSSLLISKSHLFLKQSLQNPKPGLYMVRNQSERLLGDNGQIKRCTSSSGFTRGRASTTGTSFADDALNNCRDGGQHHCASLCYVPAAGTYAQRQRQSGGARRHLAPATPVVSVAGTSVSQFVGRRPTT